jgi:autotransporter-associated beta strand protein
MRRLPLGLAVLALSTVPAAGQFTAGNLVVYQVGSGGASSPTLVNTGSPVFVSEYTPAGVGGFQVALPSSGTGTLLIASGTATSEGMMTLGNGGQTLALTGYNAATGGSTSLPGTASGTVNRTVGLVNGQGTASLSVFTDFADGNNPRSAYTPDGSNVYVVGGASGLRYGNTGSTTSTQLSTTVTNLRSVFVFGGQLYTSTASGTAVRLGAVGIGTPTTAGQAITSLSGIPNATGSPYQFVLARIGNPVGFTGPNVLYFADDGTGTINKYTSPDGSNWTAAGTAAATAVRGLTGVVTGDDQVTLYGATGGSNGTGGGTIYAFTDSAATAGTITGTAASIATAAVNSAFRGIAFSPARLEWAGGSGTWDLATPSFTNTAPTVPVAGQKFVNAYAANFGAIAADAVVTVGAGVNPLAVNVTNAANTYTFVTGAGSNGIQGLAALTKSGAGTLVLAGPNTYGGGTTVNGGTLLVNNATGSGTGAGGVAVNATGTLGGTGTIAGGVTVAANGRLRGGNGSTALGNPTLTAGAVTFTNTSRLLATVGGATPAVAASTRVSTGAAFNAATTASDVMTLDLTNDGTLNLTGTQSYTFTLATYGSTNATASNFAVNPTNFGFAGTPTITAGATALTVTFTPVPEPVAVLGAAACLVGIGGVIRRRRKATPDPAPGP